MHQQCVTAAITKQCSTLYRQARGGKEAEEYALRQCVQLHEQRPGNAPFKRNARWEGGVLDDAYRLGPAQQPLKLCPSLPLVAYRPTCTAMQQYGTRRPAARFTAMHRALLGKAMLPLNDVDECALSPRYTGARAW
jgi:hypothetical protein